MLSKSGCSAQLISYIGFPCVGLSVPSEMSSGSSDACSEQFNLMLNAGVTGPHRSHILHFCFVSLCFSTVSLDVSSLRLLSAGQYASQNRGFLLIF